MVKRTEGMERRTWSQPASETADSDERKESMKTQTLLLKIKATDAF